MNDSMLTRCRDCAVVLHAIFVLRQHGAGVVQQFDGPWIRIPIDRLAREADLSLACVEHALRDLRRVGLLESHALVDAHSGRRLLAAKVNWVVFEEFKQAFDETSDADQQESLSTYVKSIFGL